MTSIMWKLDAEDNDDSDSEGIVQEPRNMEKEIRRVRSAERRGNAGNAVDGSLLNPHLRTCAHLVCTPPWKASARYLGDPAE